MILTFEQVPPLSSDQIGVDETLLDTLRSADGMGRVEAEPMNPREVGVLAASQVIGLGADFRSRYGLAHQVKSWSGALADMMGYNGPEAEMFVDAVRACGNVYQMVEEER